MDDPDNLRQISEIAVAHKVVVGIIVELDVGQNRCGVDSPTNLTYLAKMADSLPGVTFEGIQVC